MAGAGIWAWIGRDKDIDPSYHPMSDAPSFPMAYTDETEPGFMSGVTEPSPWLEDQTGWTVADRIPDMVEVLPNPPAATQAEPYRSEGFRGFEPPTEPPAEPRFEPQGSGLKPFFAEAPYDMRHEDSYLMAAIKTAIEAGVSKSEACNYFFTFKEINGVYVEVPLKKGGSKDYQRFSDLFDSVKGA